MSAPLYSRPLIWVRHCWTASCTSIALMVAVQAGDEHDEPEHFLEESENGVSKNSARCGLLQC